MRKHMFRLMAMAAALVFAAFAAASVGAAAEPQDSITREYRFPKGSEPNIPERISQFGKEYALASRTEPALEGTLPQTRVYAYRLEGTLKKGDLELVQGLPGYKIDPVYYDRTLRVDKACYYPGGYDTLEGSIAAVRAGTQSLLPTNDVWQLPETRVYRLPSAGSPGGYADAPIRMAGVQFTVAGLDEDGLPAGYYAKAVYRGGGTVKEIGYYNVSVGYTSEAASGGIEQYVVVATYKPVGAAETPPVPAQKEAAPPEPTPAETGPEAVGTSEFTQKELDMIANQLPLSAGIKAPFSNIANGSVLPGSMSLHGAWSLLSGLLSLIAIVLAVISAVRLVVSTWTGREYEDSRDADAKAALRGHPVMRALCVVCGVVSFFIFMAFDNTILPMAWVNYWTAPVALFFALSVAFFILARRVRTDDETG